MVVVFFKMLTGDLLRFSLIYFILLAVFAQGEFFCFFFFFFLGGGTLHGYTLVGSYKVSCSLALGELTVSSSYWRVEHGGICAPVQPLAAPPPHPSTCPYQFVSTEKTQKNKDILRKNAGTPTTHILFPSPHLSCHQLIFQAPPPPPPPPSVCTQD